MKNASESAVDRLIELALEEKPAKASADHQLEAIPLLGEPGLPSLREIEHNPVWRALVQIGAFLPQVARVLDIGNPSATTLAAEVRQSVGALEHAQHDLRMAVTEQTVELKHVEETISKATEATERHASELMELGDDVRSMRSLVKTAVGVLAGVVVVLVGLVGYLVWKLPHLGR